MLYIFYGQDDFSLGKALEEIKKGIGDPSLLSANTTTIDGQQMSLDQLKATCETVPFLAEKRLVIVNGLLERFEPKSRPSRRKKTARKPDRQSDYKSMAEYFGNIPDSTELVLVDSGIKKNNPLLRELSARAKIKFFPLLKDDELRRWIKGRVKEQGGRISPATIDLLARIVGGNLWIMANEIDKLVQFAAGRSIEEEDVRTAVSYVQEANVFAMIDAILESRAGTAEKLLEQLLQRGAVPAYLLVMLSRKVQMIVRAKELRKQRKTGIEIQNKLGLKSEFVLRKTLEQAARYPMERLREVYRNLLQADLSIKTGKYEGGLALNILIAELGYQSRAGAT